MPRASTKVRLSFRCKDLMNNDLLSKSDPVVLVDHMDIRGKIFTYKGSTELIKDNLNPVFQKTVEFDYVFELKQVLRLTVLDIDGEMVPTEYTPKMKEADLLGRTEITMAEIMGARNCTVTKKLAGDNQNKDYGEITVIGLKIEDDARTDDVLVFKLKGLNLAAKDKNFLCANSSDPFFEIYKIGAEDQKMCKSEVVDQNLYPSWAEQRLPIEPLCGGDIKMKLRIRVFDHDLVKDDPIGLAEFTVEDLLNKNPIVLRDYYDPPRPNIVAGTVQADSACIHRKPVFDDYMSMGLNIRVNFAIDFTASNGQKDDPKSFHFCGSKKEGLSEADIQLGMKVVRGPDWKWDDQDGGSGSVGYISNPPNNGWVQVTWIASNMSRTHRCGAESACDLSLCEENPYQKAMSEIARIMLNFDKDKKISAYGFGGMLPGTSEASWCFPLNLKEAEVSDYQGLMDAYVTAVSNISLGDQGTNMSEMIKSLIQKVSVAKNPDQEEYHVLIIITDGDVTDYTEAGDAIVAASELPISVIVAGIPSEGETFDQWKKIDEGKFTLKDQSGKQLKRDTVNFILLDEENQVNFSERVLTEFSHQLVEHFSRKNIPPRSWGVDPLKQFHFCISDDLLAQ